MQEQRAKNLPYAERLEEFIQRKGITMYRLAVDSGLHTQTVIGVINRRSDPRASTLEAIIKAFPELNIYWLLTGEGEMLKSGGAGRGGNSVSSAADEQLIRHQRVDLSGITVNNLGKTKGVFSPILPLYICRNGNNG